MPTDSLSLLLYCTCWMVSPLLPADNFSFLYLLTVFSLVPADNFSFLCLLMFFLFLLTYSFSRNCWLFLHPLLADSFSPLTIDCFLSPVSALYMLTDSFFCTCRRFFSFVYADSFSPFYQLTDSLYCTCWRFLSPVHADSYFILYLQTVYLSCTCWQFFPPAPTDSLSLQYLLTVISLVPVYTLSLLYLYLQPLFPSCFLLEFFSHLTEPITLFEWIGEYFCHLVYLLKEHLFRQSHTARDRQIKRKYCPIGLLGTSWLLQEQCASLHFHAMIVRQGLVVVGQIFIPGLNCTEGTPWFFFLWDN